MKNAWSLITLLWCIAGPASAFAQERYALIVAGASGGAEYSEQYNGWTTQLASTLRDRFRIPDGHVVTLTDAADPQGASTAANVRKALADLQKKAIGSDDLLLLFLIGHGTFDGVDAKFNLVGRDLEAAEWAALLKPLPGRLVVVNTTAGSFPFLERLASSRRVVITATDSHVQRFDTQLAEFFIKALSDQAADLDKNGRVSMWEAFAAATAGVRRYYQQRGQLATERPLLDDNGDGIGHEAGTPGEDGALASRVYLDADAPGGSPTDEALLKLLQRRSVLESEVEEIKVRRTFMSAAEYERDFERLMIELARVSHDIRKASDSR